MAVMVEPLRTEQDIAQCAPVWAWKFVRRLATLERGRAYDVTVIVPDDEAEPVWIVRAGGKLENGRK